MSLRRFQTIQPIVGMTFEMRHSEDTQVLFEFKKDKRVGEARK